MNDKETAEIRRRFQPEKSGIERIRGCYVSDKGEIISEFKQSFGLMSQEEGEELLAILKKTLSGSIGKNLTNIDFTAQQVLESEEHHRLTALRASCLDDEEAVRAIYEKIIGSVDMEGNYLILLACDRYDVPKRAKDGLSSDESESVFTYILCSVCPVKLSKPALGYYAYENRFRNIAADWVVAAPELGFMFPAYEDRAANIYRALYYCRSIAENHSEFAEAVFHAEPLMPAAVQKETFQAILEESIADSCKYEVVQTVHEQLCEMIEEHKASKEKEPLVISKSDVKSVLKKCGVDETLLSSFDEKYDAGFGENAEINPDNLVDKKQFEVCTPDVTIRVNPENSDLIETRVIDGVKYILIRADSEVEVNGVHIQIT